MDPKEQGKHKRSLFRIHKKPSKPQIFHGKLLKESRDTVPLVRMDEINANSGYDPEAFRQLRTTSKRIVNKDEYSRFEGPFRGPEGSVQGPTGTPVYETPVISSDKPDEEPSSPVSVMSEAKGEEVTQEQTWGAYISSFFGY